MTSNTIICHNTSCRRNVNTTCQKSFTCLDQDGKCITEQPDEEQQIRKDKTTE